MGLTFDQIPDNTSRLLTQKHSKKNTEASVQPKLEVGDPDSEMEHEADNVADMVMQMPEPAPPMSPPDDEEEGDIQMKRLSDTHKIDMKPAGSEGKNGISAPDSVSQTLRQNQSVGKPLRHETQLEMTAKIGHNFSPVSIHTGSDAIQMNSVLGSRAFTHGNDIYFNKNEYTPNTSSGKHLLAHELTHVVQQDGRKPVVQRQTHQNLAGMTNEEKWEIVYGEAIYGAGDGLIMAMILILGLILLIALAGVIIGFLCPACIAAIEGFLAMSVMGATVGTWLTAVLASVGIAVALETMRAEFARVNSAVSQAQSEDELRAAGRRWGERTGAALAEIIASIFAATSHARNMARNISRRLPRGRTRRTSGPASGQPAATGARTTNRFVDQLKNTFLQLLRSGRGGVADVNGVHFNNIRVRLDDDVLIVRRFGIENRSGVRGRGREMHQAYEEAVREAAREVGASSARIELETVINSNWAARLRAFGYRHVPADFGRPAIYVKEINL